ncbi:hypothetical protein [Mariprofundus aestuarium]|nr:hypothetical protein [Mariprofundus aestuarium]
MAESLENEKDFAASHGENRSNPLAEVAYSSCILYDRYMQLKRRSEP